MSARRRRKRERTLPPDSQRRTFVLSRGRRRAGDQYAPQRCERPKPMVEVQLDDYADRLSEKPLQRREHLLVVTASSGTQRSSHRLGRRAASVPKLHGTAWEGLETAGHG